jgi:hypothetical protein
LRRRLVAWLGLGALLFLRLAVAAYACATLTNINGVAPTSTAVAASHAHCQTKDQRPSKLCEQHCQQVSQSVDMQPTGVPAVPNLPLIGVVEWPDVHAPGKRDFRRARLPGAVDPPPLVRFGVLRI